ncbi:MAG TPA: phosphate signaling complex protein PhoU [Anaerolineales bacterium]|nr:phosphate signaling complex protein PhoU [Anaerolineales bacterium]
MTREYLDQTINSLRDDVLILESMVSEATHKAVMALLNNDKETAKRVYLNDKVINEKRFQMENEILIVIATQQPLATDLRILASILEIVTELERMGDYAKKIAKINLQLTEPGTLIPAAMHLKEMMEITVVMLKKGVKAFVDVDVETARALPAEDDKVDEIFNHVTQELLDSMVEKKSTVGLANQIQWAAHNMERMSDRVVNICERTIFIATGEMNELEESDDEWVLDLDA